jgi:hypothetical protein
VFWLTGSRKRVLANGLHNAFWLTGSRKRVLANGFAQLTGSRKRVLANGFAQTYLMGSGFGLRKNV